MATTEQLEKARQAGIAAKKVGQSYNPYSQETGKLWHVSHQDELFQAWNCGYRA